MGAVVRPKGPNGEAPRPLRPFASSRESASPAVRRRVSGCGGLAPTAAFLNLLDLLNLLRRLCRLARPVAAAVGAKPPHPGALRRFRRFTRFRKPRVAA